MAATSLMELISTRWDEKNLDSTVTGGFRSGRPEQNQAFPYATLNSAGGVRTGRSTMAEYWDHTFQIQIFGESASQLTPLVRAVGEAMDFAPIDFADMDDGEVMSVNRQNDNVFQDEQQVWQALLTWVVKRRKRINRTPT